MVGWRAWPEGLFAAHKSVGMEGHATGGTQVCHEGRPDGAVVMHKGAGMEGQMVGGWIKRFPAALMGARRTSRYTDPDKQTQARPRLHALRRGAERVSRAQENIVTIGWTKGGGMVRDGNRLDDAAVVIRVVRAQESQEETDVRSWFRILPAAIPEP